MKIVGDVHIVLKLWYIHLAKFWVILEYVLRHDRYSVMAQISRMKVKRY